MPLATSIRLPPELKDQLAELAKADRRSVSSYIVLALEDHVRAKRSASGRAPIVTRAMEVRMEKGDPEPVRPVVAVVRRSEDT